MKKVHGVVSKLLSRNFTSMEIDAPPSGCFAWLHGHEEIVVLIAERVLHIPKDVRECVKVVEMAKATSDTLFALSSSSKYINQTLKTMGLHTIREAICRHAVELRPNQWSSTIPFVHQYHAERASERLVKFAKRSISSIAFHCASNHCLSVRKNVNLHIGSSLNVRVAVAHVSATRIAACSDRASAVLFCRQESKRQTPPRRVVSNWLTLVDDKPGIWSLHTEIHVEARVACPENVVKLSAAHDGSAALAVTESGNVLLWKTHQDKLIKVRIPPHYYASTIWFHDGSSRALLCSEYIQENPETLDIPPTARSAVVHLDRGGQVTRWSNEQYVVHTHGRPDQSGLRLLTVTHSHGNSVSVRLLNTQQDSYEMVTEDSKVCGEKIFVTALAPSGHTCAVLCSLGHVPVCNILCCLSEKGWHLSSSLVLSSSPHHDLTQNTSDAAFTSCGSMLTFFSVCAIGPRFCSITVSAMGKCSSVDIVVSAIEHLPREVQFGASGMFLKTHRGVLLISPK